MRKAQGWSLSPDQRPHPVDRQGTTRRSLLLRELITGSLDSN